MWHDHQFSQENKATERAVEVNSEHWTLEVEIGGVGGGQKLKKRGRQYRGSLHRTGGLGTLCQQHLFISTYCITYEYL